MMVRARIGNRQPRMKERKRDAESRFSLSSHTPRIPKIRYWTEISNKIPSTVYSSLSARRLTQHTGDENLMAEMKISRKRVVSRARVKVPTPPKLELKIPTRRPPVRDTRMSGAFASEGRNWKIAN